MSNSNTKEGILSMSMRCKILVPILLAVVVQIASPARADLVLDFTNNSTLLGNGPIPSTNGTYAEVAFSYVNSNTVQAVFSVPNASVSGLFVSDIALMFNATGASFSRLSGITATSATFSGGGLALQGSGGENFNTLFTFETSNAGGGASRLKNGQPSTYNITLSGVTLNTSLSNLLKTPDVSGHNFTAGVHIQGYTVNGTGASASLAVGAPATATPEPATVVLALTGILPFGILTLRRRLRRV